MERPRSARWPVAAGLLLAAVAALLLAAGRRLHRVEVAGDSMQPGLAPGDYLLLRSGAISRGRAAGAIVAFEAPAAIAMTSAPRPAVMLKRIVGLPGEMLRIGAEVEVNGRILEEPYRRGVAPESGYRGVHAVPPGHYFVLGDSRGQSTDSREFGTIAADRISGEAIWRYWPPRRFGRIAPERRRWRETSAVAS